MTLISLSILPFHKKSLFSLRITSNVLEMHKTLGNGCGDLSIQQELRSRFHAQAGQASVMGISDA